MLTQQLLGMALLGAEWILWILVFLSVMSIAIMIERAWYFHQQRADLTLVGSEVRRLVAAGDVGQARARLSEFTHHLSARVLSAGLDEATRGHAAAAEAMAGAKALARVQLERNLAFLGTLGSNAPFIGLFGTVIGIIKAFHDLATAANKGPAIVMGSLSEALVATAVGLIVAIPAVLAYNIFQRRIRSLMLATDSLAHSLLAELCGSRPVAPLPGGH